MLPLSLAVTLTVLKYQTITGKLQITSLVGDGHTGLIGTEQNTRMRWLRSEVDLQTDLQRRKRCVINVTLAYTKRSVGRRRLANTS